MTNKIIESSIETFSTDLLEKYGHQYIYGPDITADSERKVFFSEKDSVSTSPPLGGRGAPEVRPIFITIPAGTK